MSQDPNSLADASQPSTYQDQPKEVRELRPILWDGDMKKDMMDLRPLPTPVAKEDEDTDLDEILSPKDSSVVEPVDSSDSATKPANPSSETPVKIAVPTVAKGNTRA